MERLTSQVSLSCPQLYNWFLSLLALPSELHEMFSVQGQTRFSFKSDKWPQQRRVIPSAHHSPLQRSLASHTDNSWIVLSAGMNVCEDLMLH